MLFSSVWIVEQLSICSTTYFWVTCSATCTCLSCHVQVFKWLVVQSSAEGESAFYSPRAKVLCGGRSWTVVPESRWMQQKMLLGWLSSWGTTATWECSHGALLHRSSCQKHTSLSLPALKDPCCWYPLQLPIQILVLDFVSESYEGTIEDNLSHELIHL